MDILIFYYDIVILFFIIVVFLIIWLVDVLLYKVRCKKGVFFLFKSIQINDINEIYIETDKNDLYFQKKITNLDVLFLNQFKVGNKVCKNEKIYTISKVVKRFEVDFFGREVFFYNVFFKEFLNIELPFVLELYDDLYKKIIILDAEILIFSEKDRISIESIKINRSRILINDLILISLKGISKKDFFYFEFLLNKYFYK